MPYKKTFRKSARRGRRAGGRRRYRTPGKTFSRAVKKVIGYTKDRKMVEQSLTTSVSTAGAAFEITGLVVQGSTDQTREGAEIYMKSLYIDAFMLAGEEYNIMRMSVVRWRKQGVASPVMTPLFNGIPGVTGSWDTDRWEIIYDKSVGLSTNSVDATTGAATTPVPRKFTAKIPIKRKVHYEQTTGTGNQQIIYLLQSDSGILPNPGIDGIMTIRFVDN